MSSFCAPSDTKALAYHRLPSPGKFSTIPSKQLDGQADLALAYSPGVADACQAIVKDPQSAGLYTIRNNLVAVISNGTAVLGLGDIGALASKPVMEGKAVLFQKFSGLNAIDLEINETDPIKLIAIIASLAPSFGGINLEDIKAPDCFLIEKTLEERLDIPVFHDDQHGTAITVSAALMNALSILGKTLDTVKCVVSGAGASALACLKLLVELGMRKENIFVFDTKGLIHMDRCDLSPHKLAFAQSGKAVHLEEAACGADVLIGLSRPGAFSKALIAAMAPDPIVFALSNPVPEIWPHEVIEVAPRALVGTGRSDLKNQVNNVLCFPYIFRGALDVGATHITMNMKKACVHALSGLVMEGFSDLTGAYEGENCEFGPEYFLPKAFDPRLLVDLPVAVAQAAMADGVNQRPLCLKTYRHHLIRKAFENLPYFSHLLRHSSYGSLDKKRGPLPSVLIKNPNHVMFQVAQALVRFGIANPCFIGYESEVRPLLSSYERIKSALIVPEAGLQTQDISPRLTMESKPSDFSWLKDNEMTPYLPTIDEIDEHGFICPSNHESVYFPAMNSDSKDKKSPLFRAHWAHCSLHHRIIGHTHDFQALLEHVCCLMLLRKE